MGLAALVVDRGDERDRRLRVGHALSQGHVGDPNVLDVIDRHLTNLHRTGQLLEVFSLSLGRPIGHLLIGNEKDSPGALGRVAAAGLQGPIDCLSRAGHAVNRVDSRQGFQGVFPPGTRLVIQFRRASTYRQDRDQTSTGQSFDELAGLGLGVIQQDAVGLLVGHTQAVIDQHHGVHPLIGIDGRRGKTVPVGPGQCQAEGQQASRRSSSNNRSRSSIMRRLRVTASRKKSMAAHGTTRNRRRLSR